jgi:hypothetical protein
LKALQAGHLPLSAATPRMRRKGNAYEKNTQNTQKNTKSKCCHVQQKRPEMVFFSDFCCNQRQVNPYRM